VLDHDQLARLERYWVEQGAPVARRLRPGLTPSAMDALVGPLGLRLPAEAQTWWGWHDGAALQPGDLAKDIELRPGCEFGSLADAVRIYRERREMAADVHPDDPDRLWPRPLLPVSRYGDIACWTDVPDGAPGPMWEVDWHDERGPRPVASSFGEVVDWWLEQFAAGEVAWRADVWWRRPYAGTALERFRGALG
jgi:hypothetical protein